MSPMFCTPVETQFLTCEAGPRQFTDHGTGKPVRDLFCQTAHLTDLLVDSGLLQSAEGPDGSNFSVCCHGFGNDAKEFFDLLEILLQFVVFSSAHEATH